MADALKTLFNSVYRDCCRNDLDTLRLSLHTDTSLQSDFLFPAFDEFRESFKHIHEVTFEVTFHYGLRSLADGVELKTCGTLRDDAFYVHPSCDFWFNMYGKICDEMPVILSNSRHDIPKSVCIREDFNLEPFFKELVRKEKKITTTHCREAFATIDSRYENEKEMRDLVRVMFYVWVLAKCHSRCLET
jgi:hypothetical protein